MERFYMGSGETSWLGRTDTPLCVSLMRSVTKGRKTFPRARCRWFLDSGGFSELSAHGRWRLDAARFVGEVRALVGQTGAPDGVAIQDWMCEPWMVAKTGLSVAEHQRRTVENYGELLALAPELPWVPVLQGWAEGEHDAHLEQYDRAGFDLRAAPLVGVGSVCRRQHTAAAVAILGRLAAEGLRLHGFGFKIQGVQQARGLLRSSDSNSWTKDARYLRRPWCGSKTHINCAACLAYAEHWYGLVSPRLVRPDAGGVRQLGLWEG